MSTHNDFDVEPLPGLPALPPAGERIIWQGKPEWRTVARRILHIRSIAAYFGVIVLWRITTGLYDGQSIGSVLTNLLPLAGAAAISLGLLALISRGIARTTIYTITNRRVVLRFGVALPVTFNIPFAMIASAGVRDLGSGQGDLTLGLLPGKRIAYLVLWPHVRPWQLRSPQPMLRAIPEVINVAALLRDALAADPTSKTVRVPVAIDEPMPAINDRFERPAILAAAE